MKKAFPFTWIKRESEVEPLMKLVEDWHETQIDCYYCYILDTIHYDCFDSIVTISIENLFILYWKLKINGENTINWNWNKRIKMIKITSIQILIMEFLSFHLFFFYYSFIPLPATVVWTSELNDSFHSKWPSNGSIITLSLKAIETCTVNFGYGVTMISNGH